MLFWVSDTAEDVESVNMFIMLNGAIHYASLTDSMQIFANMKLPNSDYFIL